MFGFNLIKLRLDLLDSNYFLFLSATETVELKSDTLTFIIIDSMSFLFSVPTFSGMLTFVLFVYVAYLMLSLSFGRDFVYICDILIFLDYFLLLSC